MPGVVDTSAPMAQQVAQLCDALVAQGLDLNTARSIAWDKLAPLPDPFTTISDTDGGTFADQIADQTGLPRDQIINAGFTDELGRSAEFLLGYAEGAGFSILATGGALIEVAKSPLQFANGVKALLTSAQARGQFSQDFIDRVRIDVQMLEDAFNAGDLRGTGQQLGKLTADFAQLAGGVEALARLGVTGASAGGRLLAGTAQTLAPAIARVRELFANLGTQVSDDVAIRIAGNFGRDGDFFTQVAEQMAQARAAGWKTADGRIWWPPNDGAVPGSQFITTIKPGAVLDRFGGTSSRSTFLAPSDTPLGQRALAPSIDFAIRDQYLVVKEFSLEQSVTMPWFGKEGMGIQFNSAKGIELTIEELVQKGFIKKVGP